MIQIKKGNNILEVSKATYESIFKRMGFEIVDNDGAKEKAPSKSTITKKVENEKIEKKEKKKDISNNEDKKNNKDEKNDLDNILDMISDNKK